MDALAVDLRVFTARVLESPSCSLESPGFRAAEVALQRSQAFHAPLPSGRASYDPKGRHLEKQSDSAPTPCSSPPAPSLCLLGTEQREVLENLAALHVSSCRQRSPSQKGQVPPVGIALRVTVFCLKTTT